MSVESPLREQTQDEFLADISLPDVLHDGLLSPTFLNQLDPRLAAGQTPDVTVTLAAGNVMIGQNYYSIVLPNREAVLAMNVLSVTRAVGVVAPCQLAALGANVHDTGSAEAIPHGGKGYSTRLNSLGKQLGGVGVVLDRNVCTNFTLWRLPSLVAFRSESEEPTNEAFAELTVDQQLWFAHLVLKALDMPFPTDEVVAAKARAETGLPKVLRRLRNHKLKEREALKEGRVVPVLPAPPTAPEPEPETIPEDANWRIRGLCRNDPDLFFAKGSHNIKKAKRVCAGCEVRAKCLEDAIAWREESGVLGGMSERERRKLFRKLDAEEAARQAASGASETLPDDVLASQFASNQNNADGAETQVE